MKRLFPIAASAWIAAACASFLIRAHALSLSSLERLDLCFFHRIWGFQCPGCGMGHAMLFAFQGDWRASFSAHPFGIPLLLFWTGWLIKPDRFQISLSVQRVVLGALLVGHALR